MDMNAYTVEVIVRDRLAELRAAAACPSRSIAPPRSTLRLLQDGLGRAFVWLGTRLLGVRDRPHLQCDDVGGLGAGGSGVAPIPRLR